MLLRYFYHCASIMALIVVSFSFAVDADDDVVNRRLGHTITPDKHGDSAVEKIDVFGRTLYKTYWKAPGQQQQKKKKKTKPKISNWNRAWQEPKKKPKRKPTKKKHGKESRSEGEEGWHGVMSMLDRF